MFRASNTHLHEDTVVQMQHIVVSPSMRVLGGLSAHSLSENSLKWILTHAVCRQATKNSHREWQ